MVVAEVTVMWGHEPRNVKKARNGFFPEASRRNAALLTL